MGSYHSFNMGPAVGFSAFESMFYGSRDESNLVNNILVRLPIHLRINISRTSRAMLNLIRNYHSSLWDPDMFLKQWVDDPIAFRARLGHCDAVITGAPLLDFLDPFLLPKCDSPGPLDLCLRLDGVMAMASYLENEGYVYNPYWVHEYRTKGCVRSYVQSVVRNDLLLQSPLTAYGWDNPRLNILRKMNFEREIRTSGSGGTVETAHQVIQLTLVHDSPIHSIMNGVSSTSFKYFFIKLLDVLNFYSK